MGILQLLYEWVLNDIVGTVDPSIASNVETVSLYMAWFILVLILACIGYLVEWVITTISVLFPWQ